MIVLILCTGANKTSENTTTESQSLQTLKSCMHNQSTWSTDSFEYKSRILSIKKMLVGTGSSVSLVDHPDFIDMLKTFDRKFKTPGNLIIFLLLVNSLILSKCIVYLY